MASEAPQCYAFVMASYFVHLIETHTHTHTHIHTHTFTLFQPAAAAVLDDFLRGWGRYLSSGVPAGAVGRW